MQRGALPYYGHVGRQLLIENNQKITHVHIYDSSLLLPFLSLSFALPLGLAASLAEELFKDRHRQSEVHKELLDLRVLRIDRLD